MMLHNNKCISVSFVEKKNYKGLGEKIYVMNY